MDFCILLLKDFVTLVSGLVVPILLAYIALRQHRQDEIIKKYDRSKYYVDCYEKIKEGCQKIMWANASIIPDEALVCYQEASALADIYLADESRTFAEKCLQQVISAQGLVMAENWSELTITRSEIGKHIIQFREIIRKYTVL